MTPDRAALKALVERWAHERRSPQRGASLAAMQQVVNALNPAMLLALLDDAERLDWLARNASAVTLSDANGDAYDAQWEGSLRDMIDAARTGGSTNGEG